MKGIFPFILIFIGIFFIIFFGYDVIKPCVDYYNLEFERCQCGYGTSSYMIENYVCSTTFVCQDCESLGIEKIGKTK